MKKNRVIKALKWFKNHPEFCKDIYINEVAFLGGVKDLSALLFKDAIQRIVSKPTVEYDDNSEPQETVHQTPPNSTWPMCITLDEEKHAD